MVLNWGLYNVPGCPQVEYDNFGVHSDRLVLLLPFRLQFVLHNTFARFSHDVSVPITHLMSWSLFKLHLDFSTALAALFASRLSLVFAIAFSTFSRYFSKAFTAFVSGCSHIVCPTHIRLFLIGLFNCSYFDLSYSPSVRNIYLPVSI